MWQRTFSPSLPKVWIPALAALLFTACGWDCPGIPEDLPWFIAEDYMYRTVAFTNGKDTVYVEYEGILFENRADKDVRSDNYGMCELFVRQKGISQSPSFPGLEYGLYSFLSHKYDPAGYALHFGMNEEEGDARSYVPEVDISPDLINNGMVDTTMNGYCTVQYLVEWKSPQGVFYNRVLKVGLDREYHTFASDTFYFADRKGLVQMDLVSKGETWYLVPPEVLVSGAAE